MNEHPQTVRDLRRRWKPRKDSSDIKDLGIRLRRAWSWMTRTEQLAEGELACDDARLIYAWIALNSLYGRWDPQQREPMPDWRTLKEFTSLLLRIDNDGLLEERLCTHKKLVTALIGDEYLSQHFWEDPGERTARQAQNVSKRLGGMYIEKRFGTILDETLKRVYLARCQLVHGAATFNSRLNRTALRRCATFMELLLPTISIILIDHAPDSGWGQMCYPPME